MNSMHLRKSLMKLQAISKAIRLLEKNRVPDLSSSVDIIINHAITISKSIESNIQRRNYSHKMKVVQNILKGLRMRQYHCPIQYIIGQWPFRNITLKMKQPVLIPRFQTEYFVGLIVDAIKAKYPLGSCLKIADLGCGSGAIGISLMKQLKNYSLSIVFVDISQVCIDLTRQNIIKNGIQVQKVKFILGDMIQHLDQLVSSCNVIVSNPPYLKQTTFRKLQKQVKNYQSKFSLISGQSGLEFVQPILNSIRSEKQQRTDILCAIQFGGESLKFLNAQQFIVKDQYGRRRYIFL